MATVRIDGVDYDPSTTAFQQAHAKFVERADSQARELTQVKADRDKQQARADQAEAKVKELEGKLKESGDTSRLDSLVQERLDLIEKARSILPQGTKFDGKSASEIKRMCIEHKTPSIKLDGKSEDYISASFDMLAAGVSDEGNAAVHRQDGGGALPGGIPKVNVGNITLPEPPPEQGAN